MQYNNSSQTTDRTSAALVCMANVKNPNEFSNAILEAADNAGCQFLFEVPSELFGYEDSRAAAIKLNAYSEDGQLAFVLCNKETGVIHVVSNDEAPVSVLRFVESYANVLSFMQANNVTSH